MLTTLDLIASIWFLFCWLGYSLLIRFCNRKIDNIHNQMHQYRITWMNRAISRPDPAVDTIALGNLMKSVSFFASTSILIVAALIPLFSYGDKANILLAALPYTISNPSPIWEIKTLLLIVIFIYSFFKYTWALRQYNYASIIILSIDDKPKSSTESLSLAERNANILSNAARHFSMGIRGYYFALAALSWYLHPYIFIIATTLVTAIIFRREFLSKALDILSTDI